MQSLDIAMLSNEISRLKINEKALNTHLNRFILENTNLVDELKRTERKGRKQNVKKRNASKKMALLQAKHRFYKENKENQELLEMIWSKMTPDMRMDLDNKIPYSLVKIYSDKLFDEKNANEDVKTKAEAIDDGF